jgi:hypothetical protein
MGAAKNKAVGEGNSERIFVRIKSNNFKEGDGFGYCIEARPLQEQSNIVATRIIWEESLKGEAGELLADAESGGRKIPKSEEAEQFLMTFLKDGGKPQKEIEAAAKAIGIAGITLRRAAAFLVEKIKVGEAGWNWKLPQWN